MQAYKQAAAAAEDADTCLCMMLQALSRERHPPFDTSLCRQLAPQLRALQAALAGCCDGLAATVEGSLPFGAALARLAELEARCARWPLLGHMLGLLPPVTLPGTHVCTCMHFPARPVCPACSLGAAHGFSCLGCSS